MAASNSKGSKGGASKKKMEAPMTPEQQETFDQATASAQRGVPAQSTPEKAPKAVYTLPNGAVMTKR